jgi:hypothetical protein
MAIKAEENLASDAVIRQLILEAGNSAKKDRRSDVRVPFFRPVSITLIEVHRYSAFSREISTSSVGLMHSMELPLGEVALTISSDQGYSIAVRGRITWCESCGEGWYLSACKFIGLPTVAG